MKNNKSYIILFFSLALILTFFACGHSHADGDGHDHDHASEQHSEDDGHGHGEDHAEGEIHLTKEQIETMNIQFGDFSQVKINDFIKATGTLDLPPNAYAAVSGRADGFIRGFKKYVEGSYIKKGAVIGYLENPDFIQKQQIYLEVQSELTFLNQELARQQKLVTANAGVEKKLQQLQSEVNVKTATLKGIAKQLAYLGISSANLTPDNITESIAIISPMSGYITSVNMHNGMYVTPQVELLEIVDENHLHLELDVFEKDIANVKVGQTISYTVPALGNEVFDADVYIIGKEFNTQNKTVRIHGHLEKKRPKFIKELFVEAKIWLNDQTVQALPEKAIIKDGDFSYIYVANDNADDEIKFEQIKVIPSNSDNGFTAVKLIDQIPAGMKVVTNGAYYVFAQSKAGELSHEH
ncbi:MAG: efflux RND transporter periplasmic adaptor subunit [Saprospiraceae bacterium]|jgi:cobalt-zinc-cadmium efflux system membrane fusion protein